MAHKEPIDDGQAAANRYYQEAAGNTAAPYGTGVALEIPRHRPPLTATNAEAEEKWPMTLQEAMEIAMANSQIVRQIRGNTVTATATMYEPAAAETKVQEELARFDTSLIFNLFWGDESTQLNSNVAPSGGTVNIGSGTPFNFKQDSFGGVAARNTGLQGSGDLLSVRKLLANGAELAFGFNTDYTLSNVPATNRAFRAAYDSRVFGTFRLPLLNGAGVDVNRAPILIARLRSDQSLWDFRKNIGDLIRDVEQKYWELYAAQWQFWSTKEALKSNRKIMQTVEAKLEDGTGDASDRNEANVQYFALQRAFNSALAGDVVTGSRVAGIQVVERQLRALLGLPPSDGRRIVAIDDPLIAPVQPDWDSAITEAFTYNPDLQKLKLGVAEQRQALLLAQNGILPRVDLFARHEIDGLGGQLDDSVAVVTNDAFGTWTYGVQAQVNIGYRKETAQLQRTLLQLKEAKDVLRDKGREVEDLVAQSLAQLTVRYEMYKASRSAKEAAKGQLDTQSLLYQEGKFDLNRLLKAVQSYAEAVNAEVQDLIEYQIALANLENAKGTIFAYNNVHIQEGAWSPAAYPQSALQAADRQRAIDWYCQPKYQAKEQDRMSVYEETKGTNVGLLKHEGETIEQPPLPSPEAKGPLELPVELGRRKPAAQPSRLDEPVKTVEFETAPPAEILLRKPKQ